MLNIRIIEAINLPYIDQNKHNYFVTILFDNNEIYRTSTSNLNSNLTSSSFSTTSTSTSNSYNPIWNEIFNISLDNFKGKIKENNRPLFLEYLYINLYIVHDKNSYDLIGETRVLLNKIGTPQYYRLLKPEVNSLTITSSSSAFSSYSTSLSSSSNLGPSKEIGQLAIALTLFEDNLGEGRTVGYQSLHEEMSNKMIQYAPLFLNFDLSPLSLIGADPLPGPLIGEIILDRHEFVEVINIIILYYFLFIIIFFY